jgi:hypothetical protein
MVKLSTLNLVASTEFQQNCAQLRFKARKCERNFRANFSTAIFDLVAYDEDIVGLTKCVRL